MSTKILFFVDDYSGGAGNVIQILANEFEKFPSYTPVVAVLNPHTSKYKLSPSVKTVEYRLANNRSNNKLIFFWRNIKTLRRIIKQENPDVIISFINNINTAVSIACLFNKIPIIVSERSNPMSIKPYGLYRHLRPLAYRRANIITVQCGYFMDFMPSQKYKMEVTPNPVIKPRCIKQNYDASANTIKFVSCARLAPIKQFDKMIRAFILIHDSNSNTSLTIYGEGSERDNLQQLIAQLNLENCVFLPGASQDVFSCLHDSDIYLMTSQQEGFPNALCEAMSVGLPAIAFECHPGLRDIINNGNNGFLVPADNINEMAQCANALIHDAKLRESIGNKAKEVANKFSTSAITSIWENLINKSFVQKR